MPRGKIEIVPRGWDHADWVGPYYPPDLPRAWRLSYFANEFPGVLVPADVWPNVASEAMAGWARDVLDRFHIYLELPDAGEARDLRRASALLSDSLAGLVLGAGRPPPAAGELPLYRAAGTLGRSVLGRVGDQAAGLATEIQDFPGADLRAARSWLEALARASPASSPLLVIVGGQPPDLALLRTLAELVRLAGLG